jgi:hypothetical protein
MNAFGGVWLTGLLRGTSTSEILTGVSCANGQFRAAVTQCSCAIAFNGIGWSKAVEFEPGAFSVDVEAAVSCAISSFCIAVDEDGGPWWARAQGARLWALGL